MSNDSVMSPVVIATGVVPVVAQFYDVMATVLSELKGERLAAIDLELLDLKKRQLREKYIHTTQQLACSNRHARAKSQQDLISRGLGNTTVLATHLRALDRDAKAEMISIGRDYANALHEIALTERRVRENSMPWWRRLLRRR